MKAGDTFAHATGCVLAFCVASAYALHLLPLAAFFALLRITIMLVSHSSHHHHHHHHYPHHISIWFMRVLLLHHHHHNHRYPNLCIPASWALICARFNRANAACTEAVDGVVVACWFRMARSRPHFSACACMSLQRIAPSSA